MNRSLLSFFLLWCVPILALSYTGNDEVPDKPEMSTEQPFFNANKSAFVTATSLAVLTAASAIGAMSAANAANTFGLVSYSALAVTGAALSIASVTAWFSFSGHQATTDAGTYFQKVGEHAAVAVAGTFQAVSQMLVMAVVGGVTRGISKSISRSISGPDQTIQMVR